MPSNSYLGSDLKEFLSSVGSQVNASNRDKLNLLLDELGSTNFKKISAESCQDFLKILATAMKVVAPRDVTIAAKLCHILSNAAQPHSAKIFTSDARLTGLAEDWCLRVFQLGSEMSLLQAMSALEVVLRGRAVTVDPKILTALLAENELTSLPNWLKKGQLDKLKVLPAEEVKLAALRVIKAIASPTEVGVIISGNSCPPARVRKLEACASIFIEQLSSNQPSKEIHYLKTASTCLRGLQAILLQRPSALNFVDGFGYVRAFWLLGLPEHDTSSFPPVPAEPGPPPPTAHSAPKGQKRGPIRSNNAKQVRRLRTALVKETEDDSGAGAPRQRHHQGFPEENAALWANTSDSEDFSDSGVGSGKGSRETATAFASIRFAAIRLLLLLIKNGEPQTLMSFWDQLVPYFPPGAPPPAKPSLPCCLLRDPNTGSKIAAAQCFGDILNRCQMYFAMAEASSGQLAFTPWSHTMAQSLESCQRYLMLSLSSDRVVQCLAATLNALNLLVSVTPYHRLPSGLMTRLSRSVRPFLINKNVDVKSAALSVFTALVSSSAASHQMAELSTILQKPEPASFFASVDNSSANLTSEDERLEICGLDNSDELVDFIEDDYSDIGKTWLTEYCLSHFQRSDAGLKLKLEVCRTLAAISRCYFSLLLSDNGNTLIITSSLFVNTMVDGENDIKLLLAAGRGIVDLGAALAKHLEEPDHSHNLKDGLNMWNNIIQSSIRTLSTDANPVVRSLVCDIISSIGPLIYENIDRSSRLLIAFTLFALCRDQSVSVKVQAVRALGMCANWPIEMEDGQFLLDAAEYVSSAISNEEDEGLKIKVTWALGNISDELVAKKEKGFPETLPDLLLIKLIQDSRRSCQEEKLKMNAVRSLGNLIRLLSSEQLRLPANRELVFQSISAIINCATSSVTTLMKVKWNACYALACLLRGTELHDDVPNWQANIFPALCEIVVNSPNFKVRISAAVALAAPKTRVHYQSFYLPAWNALLEALSSADNVQDFKEFQHRDNLVDQICLSICHLVSCLTPDDLSGGLNGSLIQMVMAYEEQLITQLQRVRLRIVPEKAQPFSEAVDHVKKLVEINSGMKAVCEHLTGIFNAGQVSFDEVC
ncbi:HEAT repeat-containing protein 6 isoform X2 [Neocloeon triangulifer]|uniref:HEAT repeat-containing protein 6 isoform X2 n=1 Tax=Neocloeon triangulifer TaxID=2078957 RepID=UPI00286F26C7|nr:HEAT repeat-containing protein 6 isoform X2 [Neocloeon triangulifer]